MDNLHALMKLQAELAKQLGIDEDDDNDTEGGLKGLKEFAKNIAKKTGNDDGGSAAIRLLYDSSRQWMFNVADSMRRGIIRDDEEVEYVPEAKEPKLPETEVWDFQLGDSVMIKYSRKDFKGIQKRTLGWSPRLNTIYGSIGVVYNVVSKYDNSIGVYFPDEYAGCSLYAGVLKKVQPPSYSELYPEWKVGDFVQTISCEKTLRLLQRGLDQIPNKLLAGKGRVVAVTHPSVKVTFDEVKTYDLKSSSLVECKDKTPINREEVKHPRGFTVGEEVKVKSNVKKLIENQKNFGGWNSAMCYIVGKTATVILIQKDGSLGVQTKNSRAWRLNPDSVWRAGDAELEEEDLKFRPGDVIKLKMPTNTRSVFAMAQVPMIFLEYMRSTAVLAVIDDDIDYLVRFNAEQHVQTDENLLRKATKSEKREYESIQKMVKELKVGDKVHLDVGPPNYVKAMIRELGLSPTVAMAMINSATLIGFTNPYTAVIEYENGAKFRIKKKYLTIPEKFRVAKSKDFVNPDVSLRIYDAISQSVQDMHSENAPAEDWKVEATYMSCGNPPYVEYKIESTAVTFHDVFNWFQQHSGWSVEVLGDRQFLLRGATAPGSEIKVGIIFNDEISAIDDHIAQGAATVSFEEGSIDNKTEPMRVDGGIRPPPEERIRIAGVQEFRYFKLFDPSLSRDIYFPYIVRGEVRNPAQPLDDNIRLSNAFDIYNSRVTINANPNMHGMM